MIRIMVYQVIEADGSAIMQLRSKQAAQFEMQLLIEHNNPTNPTYKMPISIREVVLETDDIGEKISQKSSMEKWDQVSRKWLFSVLRMPLNTLWRTAEG